ncbi:DNA-binding transcriptional regulator, LysR family [Pelagibacterium halotolerans]|uniref:Putative LysR-family transcriptional regulator n=2 Tax=Pelagibacterium TaxID=1082930 RepID=G4R7A6_PELHB|nr:putative LysR-family transcriptional regulator [Pelagibacterium halotolerans B2]SEA67522.1 DNA-binding transcriptional regulator, LysR family [Pelagibacterium halotolerans]
MTMHHIWRLQHFLAIAEHGSYHAAARSLNISQPALTKSILQLEAEFGTALFLRMPRGVRLTDAGEVLHVHARSIEASWNASLVELEASGNGGFGQLRIGAGPVYSAVYFPSILADLRRRFPRLTISVSTGVGSDLLPQLKSGDLRAYAGGISDETAPLGRDFVTEILYEQENSVFASADHPLFEKDTHELDDLPKFPWLSLFSGQLANAKIDNYFHRHGLPPPHLALASHSLQIARKMIVEHQFLACMPVPLAKSFDDALREIILPDFRWSITTGITYHRSAATFAPIVALIRGLKSTVGPDAQ